MSENSINLAVLRDVKAPYLAEYLGFWCMAPHVLEAAVERISGMDLSVHILQQQSKAADEGPRGVSYKYEVTPDGIAIIDVRGTLMKQESSLGESTSTVMLRRTIRNAAADPSVKSIMLRIDSPGGTTAGTEELASDIAAVSEKKPVWAFVDGLGASAAYWVASQCSEISCGPLAVVGSIGTYMVAYDKSVMAAQDGVKVHVIRSAEAKGAGVPGTEITPKQLAEWQRGVDDTQSVFTAAVASGRGISLDDAKKLADARVHVGAAAKTAGLVDNIESFDAAMERLADMSPSGPIQPPQASPKKKSSAHVASDESPSPSAQSDPAPAGDAPAHSTKETVMPPEKDAGNQSAGPQTPERKAATPAELKAALAGASSDFLFEQCENGATLAEAKDAFIGFQATQIRARDEELQKKAKDPEPRKPGVKALESETKDKPSMASADGSARSEFESLVAAQMKLGRSRSTAVANVAKDNPELHQQFIDEATAAHNANATAADAAARGRRR